MSRLLIPLAAGLVLAGCATSPLDTSAVNSRATPSQFVGSMAAHRGDRVQWGGRIVSIANDNKRTLIEVLSYPVAYDGFPNTYRKATGRFVLQHNGFLEPQDFSPGRLLTVVGTVDSLVTTSVEKTQFLVPLVNAEQLKLWPPKYGGGGNTRFGFGISVGF